MLSRIKTHIKENKKFYIGVGVGLAFAGITCIIMKGRHATLLSGVDGPSRVTVRSFFFNFFSKEPNNIVTSIHSGGRGHPGFRTRNLDYNIDFDTQGQAARAFGIPESILSSHLNGKFDDALGKRFERIRPEAA